MTQLPLTKRRSHPHVFSRLFVVKGLPGVV